MIRTITTKDIDDLLNSLNGAAKCVDSYEFGLPLWDGEIEQLRGIVRDWLRGKPTQDETYTVSFDDGVSK